MCDGNSQPHDASFKHQLRTHRIDYNSVVITKNVARSVNRDSHHAQLVIPLTFDHFDCDPHRNEFRTKSWRLNGILAFWEPQNRCPVNKNDHTCVRPSSHSTTFCVIRIHKTRHDNTSASCHRHLIGDCFFSAKVVLTPITASESSFVKVWLTVIEHHFRSIVLPLQIREHMKQLVKMTDPSRDEITRHHGDGH